MLRRAARQPRPRRASPATRVDGGTLTVDPGTYSGTRPLDYEYQWQRCDADGTSCVRDPRRRPATTYILGPADIGHTRSSWSSPPSTTAARRTETSPREPRPSWPLRRTTPSRPSITGDVTLGDDADRRHRHAGRAPLRSTFTYQWQRCDADGDNCEDIAGATDDDLHADRGRPGPHRRGGRHRDQRRRHRHAPPARPARCCPRRRTTPSRRRSTATRRSARC